MDFFDREPRAAEGSSRFVPGQVVGDRYRLVAEIGRGAMGVVWSAVNVATSREVALKLVLAQDEGLRKRLLREGRVCGALRDRNVAEVHDVGRTPEGDPFLVMERLHGETLAEALSRTPRLTPATAAALGRDVARALAAAHAVGVVHRDLKPANVFLHRAADQPEVVVKVLDFGVCKVHEPGDDLRTEIGVPVGSLAYMAPEQASGEPDVDGRADVWSLGVILFEMLAGARPFRGTRMNVIRQLLYDPLPQLAAEAPWLDATLVALVDQCLSRDREGRPDAVEMAALLDAVCAMEEHHEGPRTVLKPPRAPSPDLPPPASAPHPGRAPAFQPPVPPLAAAPLTATGPPALPPPALPPAAAPSPALPPSVAPPLAAAHPPPSPAGPPAATVRMGAPTLRMARDEPSRSYSAAPVSGTSAAAPPAPPSTVIHIAPARRGPLASTPGGGIPGVPIAPGAAGEPSAGGARASPRHAWIAGASMVAVLLAAAILIAVVR